MKTIKRRHSLAPLAVGLLLAFNAMAQDHSQHHPAAPVTDKDEPAEKQPEKPKATGHHDHAAMGHGTSQQEEEVDHAAMGHGTSQQAEEVDHAAMGHGTSQQEEEVDHAAMGHGTTQQEEEVDHAAMGHGSSQQKEEVDHAAMGHGTSKQAEEVDHAAMGHGSSQQEEEVDHAAMGHGTSQQEEEVDHAAMGHGTSQQEEDADHSAMGHGAMHAPVDPITPIPAVTDADRAAAVRPANDHPVHDDMVHSFVLFNRLEGFDADEGRGFEWEGQAWVGTDRHRAWFRSEGERAGGDTEAADLEVLYGRPIGPWWDLLAGVRHDFEPGDGQDWLALGVQGLAPYKFEVAATAYLGESGRTAARIEAEYETLITNRLVLQPLVELNFFGKNDEARGIGSGLSTAEAGLRLRYEITRRFAPYVGVVHERAFGRTADFRREQGEDKSDTRVVAGVRLWF